RAPRPPLFPYTTLFRSVDGDSAAAGRISGAQFHQRVDVAGFRIGEPAADQEFRGFLTDRSHDFPLDCLVAAEVRPRTSAATRQRSEEHTSELQSLAYLV